jgi:hypothetical protein
MGVIKHALECLNNCNKNLSPSSHTFREEVRLLACSLEVGLRRRHSLPDMVRPTVHISAFLRDAPSLSPFSVLPSLRPT